MKTPKRIIIIDGRLKMADGSSLRAYLKALQKKRKIKNGTPFNIIDHEGLKLHPPRMEYDLPAGGRRLVQDVDGYIATFVNGVAVQLDRAATDALPGVLL